jgi:lambda repressor-like predicted transcriptional regulator
MQPHWALPLVSALLYVVALRGRSSNQLILVARLAKELPNLLRQRPQRSTPHEQRQTQRRLTAEQVIQLVREYEADDDMTVLANRWQLHRTTVAGHLRRAGVALRRQGIRTEQMNEAIRLYGEGWSCQRLAERYGCSAETVRQALRQQTVQIRKPWERI